ncbi:MAG: O-methyltransferase [Phycisphaeraceae bacterium]|nr:O-methyltransferase [Phycisphaeraceae bacterium]
MDMTPNRWAATSSYLREVFGAQDEQLATLMPRAVAAGLPDIAVSADVGRLLMILTSLAGAKTVIEVGTLAGYSGIWLARGMQPGGRLITIESEPRHADFARCEFARASLPVTVDIRVGTGLDVLPSLARELGPGGADVVFLDALKREYAVYFERARPMIRPGGLLIADNALGSGNWWIDERPGTNEERDGADRLNRAVAADPDFEGVAVPIREGVLVARRIR